jgi:hypothetical protein
MFQVLFAQNDGGTFAGIRIPHGMDSIWLRTLSKTARFSASSRSCGSIGRPFYSESDANQLYIRRRTFVRHANVYGASLAPRALRRRTIVGRRASKGPRLGGEDHSGPQGRRAPRAGDGPRGRPARRTAQRCRRQSIVQSSPRPRL